MSPSDLSRNSSAFQTYLYTYSNKARDRALESTLSKLDQSFADHSRVKTLNDYEQVGSLNFQSKLLPRVSVPSPGYPSFKYLGITELEIDYKSIHKVSFVRLMVRVPQSLEETQPEILEDFLKKLIKKSKKEVFVGFPH